MGLAGLFHKGGPGAPTFSRLSLSDVLNAQDSDNNEPWLCPKPTESRRSWRVPFLVGCLGFGFSLLGALLLAGCSVGPDYQRPAPATSPAEWKAGSPWKEG
jgi:hypothetical protein